MYRRRQWHPTPVLLPGKSQGRRSLVGCSPWGRKESDITEQLHFHFSLSHIGEGNGNPLQCSCLENPREGEPGGLPSMGSHRVGLNWSNLAAAATLGSDVPTVSLSPEKNIIQSHAPQHSFQHYLQEPRHKPSKMSTDRLKLKKDLVLIDNGLLFSNEELTLQLWNHSTCSHRNGCWRITY